MMEKQKSMLALLLAAVILAAGAAGWVQDGSDGESAAEAAEAAAPAEKTEPSVSAVSAEESTEAVSSGLYVVTTDSGTWYVSAAYAEKAAGTPVPTAGEASEHVSACETGEEAESSK